MAHGAVGRDFQPAVERALDHLGIDADAIFVRKHLCGLGAVLRLLDEFGGARGGADQRRQHLRVLLRPGLAHGQHLLCRTHQNVGHEMQDVGDAEVDGNRIPGCADAERIDLAAGKTVDHIGRRQHDQP